MVITTKDSLSLYCHFDLCTRTVPSGSGITLTSYYYIYYDQEVLAGIVEILVDCIGRIMRRGSFNRRKSTEGVNVLLLSNA